MLKVKAEALAALGQWEEAQTVLAAAKGIIGQWQILPLHWEIHGVLHLIFAQLKQTEAARQEAKTTRRLIHQFAAAISDDTLRQHFLAAALIRLPTEKPLTPHQVNRLDYGGLTAREQEVAVQIALGKSNREIGQILTLSERTIEAHVGRILAKLDFNSRSRVAVWAVEKGLLPN
jgi:DNA-binding NarL/FixJ family response regulator